MSSNFAVQRQGNYGFSAVACDQTIEQTANHDSKTKGGLIEFSVNPATVHRWLLSQSQGCKKTPASARSRCAFEESGCLGMQPKTGGKLHLKLNT